jgi:hypothetical protein
METNQFEIKLIVILISICSLLATTIIAVVKMWWEAEKQASDIYDQMVKFRIEHPEVNALSRKWEPGYFRKVPKNCKRPVAEYARHRIRSHSELLQVSDNAADSATGRSRRVRLF